jgi:type I restriction enzyme S subunit
MNKLNKNNWKVALIGDYVEHIEVNERNPEKRRDAKYVSVEHTSILDLRINGVASEEQPSFNRTFKKGQVLFAKRWAISTPYPSKMAIADFDGICSPHLWALETKNGLLQNLLPYILQTNSFFDHANKNSAGSLAGVYLKWEPFANYQFKIPPPEDQKYLLSLFQSIVTSLEQVDGQEKNLLQLKNKLLRDLFSDKKEFGNHLTAKDFETVRFDKIAINISERVEPKKTELTTYVGLEHLDADNLKIERTGTPDDVIGTKLKIYKGDIIFGKRRAYLRKVAVSHFDGIASAHSMILRANEKNIEKDFLHAK